MDIHLVFFLDMENYIIDCDLRMKKWHSKCNIHIYMYIYMVTMRGWRLSKKGKKKDFFGTRPSGPKPKTSPGRMAQTPLAGAGDCVGRFRRYLCSTQFNCNCNLSLCGTFLQRLLPLPDNCGLLPTPKETYDLSFECTSFENFVISNPNIDFLYQRVLFFKGGPEPSNLEDLCREVGGWGRDPKKMYGERLGDGVEYHLMSPTPRR